MKKEMQKIFLILGIISVCAFAVFGASSIKIDIDQDLYDEIKNEKSISDSELSELVNNYLLEQIAKEKQEQMLNQYSEIGFHTSNVYTRGEVSEMNRIHGCVFP